MRDKEYSAGCFGATPDAGISHGYSPGPLVLGFILGPLTDVNFRRTLDLNHGNPLSLINRPISLLFFLATILILLNYFVSFSMIKEKLLKRSPSFKKP